jgi:RNA polymerase sigma-70 factor (ECF subfamily)
MLPTERCQRLGELLDAYGGALALFAAQWTTSADDCVQEALIRLAAQNPWPEHDVAWLYRVVRNLALNAAQAGQRRRKHEEFACRLRLEASGPRDSALEAEMVAEALDRLPAELRELIVAKVWGQLTLEQLAITFATSKSTIHRRLEQALADLRVELAPQRAE